MSDTLTKIFDVYGYDLPKERHLYSAKQETPVAVNALNKEFGSYSRFKEAYFAYCAEKRKMQTKIVTKEIKTSEPTKKLRS